MVTSRHPVIKKNLHKISNPDVLIWYYLLTNLSELNLKVWQEWNSNTDYFETNAFHIKYLQKYKIFIEQKLYLPYQKIFFPEKWHCLILFTWVPRGVCRIWKGSWRWRRGCRITFPTVHWWLLTESYYANLK